MSVDAAAVIEYIGGNESDESFVTQCIAVASLTIEHLVADRAPGEIKDRAILELSSELFHRKSAPQGVAQFQTFDGSVIRIARDPATGIYPLLRPYMGWVA